MLLSQRAGANLIIISPHCVFAVVRSLFRSESAIAPPAQVCQSSPMGRERILAILRAHAPELQSAGLVHLRLFGSVARGEATSQSDIDLLADFDLTKRITLVTVGSLQSRLADPLGDIFPGGRASKMENPVYVSLIGRSKSSSR